LLHPSSLDGGVLTVLLLAAAGAVYLVSLGSLPEPARGGVRALALLLTILTAAEASLMHLADAVG
jgi:hypothetical protein